MLRLRKTVSIEDKRKEIWNAQGYMSPKWRVHQQKAPRKLRNVENSLSLRQQKGSIPLQEGSFDETKTCGIRKPSDPRVRNASEMKQKRIDRKITRTSSVPQCLRAQRRSPSRESSSEGGNVIASPNVRCIVNMASLKDERSLRAAGERPESDEEEDMVE